MTIITTMSSEAQWRVYCQSEGVYYSNVFSTTVPGQCPANPVSHSLDDTATAILVENTSGEYIGNVIAGNVYANVLTVANLASLVGEVSIGATGSNYVFPTSRGSDGQVLQTDGSGVVTWVSGGGGNGAENIGSGANVYAQVVSDNFQFRSLVGGSSINVTEDTDTIMFDLDTVPSELKYRIAYVGERNSSASGKLAYGNGSSTIGMGAVISESGELVSVCVSTSASASGGQWDIQVNGSSVVSTAHNGLTTVDDITPVTVSPGDYVNAVQVNNGGGGNHTVTFYVEHAVNIEGIKGDTGAMGVAGTDGIAQVRTGDGVPSGGLGGDGDLYIDNLNGDYYRKDSGSWVLDGNLKGPPGGQPDYLKLTNLNVTNMNSSASGVTFTGINTTPLLDTTPGTFSVSSDTITVNSTGLYEGYFNFEFIGTVERSDVSVQFMINGTPTGHASSSDYIRSLGGHNLSSTNLLEPFSLTSGDTIQIQGVQSANTGTVSMPAGKSLIWIKKQN